MPNRKALACISSPEGNRDAVGEHTIAMLLALFNNLYRSHTQVKNGLWLREENRGDELMGKTVGIVGYGNMGKAFAKRLQGFGVRVIAYDKYKKNYGDEYAIAISQEELFATSDVLSLHIYYEAANHYLVNDAYISRFKKPFYLLNTARGLVVNTAHLVAHLKTGKILGAALDVLEYEGISFENIALADLPEPFQYLVQADNVLLSPHIAGWTHASKLKHAQTLARKIEQFYSK